MCLQSPLRLCDIKVFYVSLKKTQNLAFPTVQKKLFLHFVQTELQKLLQVDLVIFRQSQANHSPLQATLHH